VLPKRNEKDLADVPAAAKEGMDFVFVDTVREMLPAVFNGRDDRAPQPPARQRKPRQRSRRRARR
jgi:ATP-dependent Lon protease